MSGNSPDGGGHPLPASAEARANEVPENLEARKGRGDDDPATTASAPVKPDGSPYQGGDLGRGPTDNEELK